MPRFNTLSDAISDAIDNQVQKTNFPDGSRINLQLGRIPHTQLANYQYKSDDFTWGVSTWGVDNISKQYKP